MKDRKEGLFNTYYEISDLNFLFSINYLEEMYIKRDYGTGEEYTMLEVHTVTMIDKNPGITVSEIADRYGRSRSAISQLISRLENKDLVVKAHESADNLKVKNLFVSKKGRELSIAHIIYDNNQVERIIEELQDEFTLDELNIVHRYMSSRTIHDVRSSHR